RGHRDHAWNLLGLALLTQNLIDLGFALHGVASAVFLECAIFLPAGRSRKRAPRARPPMSRSRDGQSAWAGSGRWATQNCSTGPQSAVDGLQARWARGIHDNVIPQSFHVRIFYSKTFRFQ